MITTTAELEDLIDGTVNIPTIPTILTEITKIFDSPDGSARDAATVIEKDPAIATRILRLVNSPFYGLRNPVSGINLACSILGLKVIKNLVVQASVMSTFGDQNECEGLDVKWLWDHSFKAAVACKLIVEHSPAAKSMTKDDAYTCGLIHDIGKMILIDAQNRKFGEALKFSRKHEVPLAIAEGEVFGFNHAHVGGMLARRWKLADSVQAAVTYHHSPAVEPADWARSFIVKSANTLAHRAAAETPGGYRGDVLDDDSLQALQLAPEVMTKIMAQIREARML